MKLYFCDLCNESVPHQDLEEGRAFLRKGRVVCASCDQAMSLELSGEAGAAAGGATAVLARQKAGPKSGSKTDAARSTESRSRTAPAPVVVTEGGGGGLGLWAGLCALVFTVGAVALLVEKMRAIEGAVPTAIAEGRQASETWTNEQLQAERELASTQRAALQESFGLSLQEERDALNGQLTTLAQSLDSQAQTSLEIRASLAALEASMTSGNADTALALDQIGSRFAAMEEEQRWLGERLAELEVGLESGAFGGALGAPALGGAGGDAAAANTGEPAWTGLLAGLASPNSMLRWEAVDALGETGDLRVAEHLIPMLSDPDIFVRMAAARKLGDLQSVDAIPFLIDALEDPELAMREAVVSSLRSTTGQNFGFSGSASDSERAKRVKSWRSWWSKNESKLRSE